MKTKGMWFIVGTLLVILGLGLQPGATYAQDEGSQNFVFVNFVGQAVTMDLDDATYTVPGTDTMPEGGRFSMNLAEGWHKYAVNIPGGPGAAGEFFIEPGSSVAKAVRLEKSGASLAPDGTVLEPPQDMAVVFDFDPATPTEAPVVADTWQPAAVEAGQAGVVWINHSGTDEMTVDLQGQIYKIPAKQGDIPGRLQTSVAPGSYRYTASLPFGSVNGEVWVSAGQVVGINIIPGIKPEPIYEEGEKVEQPPVEMNVYQEDLTTQTATGIEPTATEPAATPPDTEPDPASVPTMTVPGLLLKNYTGDTLTFTINNQVYFVEPNTEKTVDMDAGQYSYTASVPFAAAGGMVNLADGGRVTLSIVGSLDGNTLSVYFE